VSSVEEFFASAALSSSFYLCFHSALCTEIQDIVDYKEYDIVNHLFQLAMLANKEL
jgi:hypothetical protein